MNIHRHNGFMRRGFSLLWDPRTLASICAPNAVVSMHELFTMRNAWPDDLPGAGGNALVVAGLDGCLDALTEENATMWLETDLKVAILDFQEFYQGNAAIVLWVPSGRTRVVMDRATEQYFWKPTSVRDETRLPLGRCLWGGAESDVARILATEETSPDPDGNAYVGLHHPRIS